MRKSALLLLAAGAVWMVSVGLGQTSGDPSNKASAIAQLRDIAMMLTHVGQGTYAPKIMNVAGRAERAPLTDADSALLKEISAQLKTASDDIKATSAGKASLMATASESILQAVETLTPAPASGPASAPGDSASVSTPAATPTPTPAAPAEPAAVAPPAAIAPPVAPAPAPTPIDAPAATPVAPPAAAPAVPVREMTFRLTYVIGQGGMGMPPGPPRPAAGGPPNMPPRQMMPPPKQLAIAMDGAFFTSVTALTQRLDKTLDKTVPTAAVVAAAGEITFADLQTVVTALGKYNFVSIRVDKLALRQAPPPAPVAPVAAPVPVAPPAAAPSPTPAPTTTPPPGNSAAPAANSDNQPQRAWATSAPNVQRTLNRLKF